MDTDGTTAEPKCWFITGASSGIGREVARAAAARGDKVAAVARRADALAALAGRYPERLLALPADVRDEQSVRDAVGAAVAAFGRIDVVANNAGYGLFGGVEEASDAQARSLFDTNVFGCLNVLRAVLPVLRAQRSGHVMQGSSLYGQYAHAGVGLLAATKYAVEGLSDALAAEVAPLGIKVTIVQPSTTATAFMRNLDNAEEMPDYDGTVRAVRRTFRALSVEALDSPARTAQAIVAAADSDRPPLRLAVGRQAEEAMRGALQARLKDLDDWSALTRLADG